jgi:hypothetical protein
LNSFDVHSFGRQGLFETHSRHVSGLELEGMGMDEPEVAEDPYEVRDTSRDIERPVE